MKRLLLAVVATVGLLAVGTDNSAEAHRGGYRNVYRGGPGCGYGGYGGYYGHGGGYYRGPSYGHVRSYPVYGGGYYSGYRGGYGGYYGRGVGVSVGW